MTEDWILKKSGFLDGPDIEAQEDEVTIKENIFPVIKFFLLNSTFVELLDSTWF